MAHHAKRAIAALLALLGLVLTAGGAWLAAQLGPQGTASFTAVPTGAGAVLVTPGVINRLDADFVITAVPAGSAGTVWMASGSPSDAEQILAESAVTRIVGMSVRDNWVLRQTSAGSGAAPALADADIWREVQSGAGPQTLTVTQANAPEAVVIRADGTTLKQLRITVERRAWFVQSLVLAVVGAAVLVGGVLLWRSRLGTGRAGLGKGTRAAASPTSPEPFVAARPVEPSVPTPAPEEQVPTDEAVPTSDNAKGEER